MQDLDSLGSCYTQAVTSRRCAAKTMTKETYLTTISYELKDPMSCEADETKRLSGLQHDTSAQGETILVSDKYFNHKHKRRVGRKLDCNISPMTTCMYSFNSVKKGKISNAESNGF